MRETVKFITDVKLSGSIDRGLDLIYQTIDDWAFDKRYKEIDEIMRLTTPIVGQFSLNIDYLLGVLTVTRRFKAHLSERQRFRDHCKEYFDLMREDTNALLANL